MPYGAKFATRSTRGAREEGPRALPLALVVNELIARPHLQAAQCTSVVLRLLPIRPEHNDGVALRRTVHTPFLLLFI